VVKFERYGFEGHGLEHANKEGNLKGKGFSTYIRRVI
jgi:hypothetical protein